MLQVVTARYGPAQTRSLAVLRNDIAATQAALDETVAQRAVVASRLRAASAGAEKSQLATELRVIDNQVNRLTARLAELRAEASVLESRQVTTKVTTIQVPTSPMPTIPPPGGQRGTFSSTTPPPRGLEENEMILGGVLTVFVLAPLAFALAWRLIRRPPPAISRVELAEQNERLRRIEEAVDTIAIEVERVSENQRFLTNTIASESKIR